jgi:hypothetical protein
MAEGDNRFAQNKTNAGDAKDSEKGPATAKADPIAAPRVAEDGAANDGRSTYYAGAGQKDALPEHQARRDAYPHIHASS